MAVDLDDAVFDASSYDLNIPTLDDRKATQLSIRFAGFREALIGLRRTTLRYSRP
jgi:hypothetical protein